MGMKKLDLQIDNRQRYENGPPGVVEALGLSAAIDNPLILPELFQNILDCFHPATDATERRALASLAQTCRVLSNPSLDRLWKRLYSLKPFIRCYTTLDEFETEQTPPSPSQFAIIDRYSHRVRELTISETTSLRFLRCTSMRPSLLLPQLTNLRWSPFGFAPHFPIIFMKQLLSPTLVSLEVTLVEEDELVLQSFFESYPRLCQALKSVEFRLSGQLQSEATIKALSRSIRHVALESAKLHALVDESALRHLFTSPTLKLLTVSIPEISSGSFLPPKPLLPNVEELELKTSNLELVTNLLQPCEKLFHTFSLFLDGRQTSQAFFEFLKVLTSGPPTTSLQKLVLSVGDFSQPVPADRMFNEAELYRLSYRTLRPLMVLSSLRELMIEWSEQVSLDDQELGELVRCWPSLQVFNVYCGRGGYPPFSAKYPTLQSLLSLADSCRMLNAVSLPLDAREIPHVQEDVMHETYFATIVVPESPINEALPVAKFLCKHLPSVTGVDARFLRPPGTDDNQINAYEVSWQKVDQHLEAFYDADLEPTLDLESDLESTLDSDV